MFDLGPQTVYALIAVAIMLLVGFPVHEFMHAYAANRLGDSTARWQGRLTLDPRVHIDPLGASLLALSALFGGIFIGWARPTPVNPMNLQGGRRGEAIVAVAGPLSNLVLAALFAILFRVLWANGLTILDATSEQVWETVINIVFFLVTINVSLFIFNLLPVPPLDGWAALLGLVDSKLHWQLRSFQARYAQFIPIVFLVIILAGGRVLGGAIDSVTSALVGI
jgi:Zn-dependent protease